LVLLLLIAGLVYLGLRRLGRPKSGFARSAALVIAALNVFFAFSWPLCNLLLQPQSIEATLRPGENHLSFVLAGGRYVANVTSGPGAAAENRPRVAWRAMIEGKRKFGPKEVIGPDRGTRVDLNVPPVWAKVKMTVTVPDDVQVDTPVFLRVGRRR
jgi:hypothetical protein